MSLPGDLQGQDMEGGTDGQRSQEILQEKSRKGWGETGTHIPGRSLILPRIETQREERMEAYGTIVCEQP